MKNPFCQLIILVIFTSLSISWAPKASSDEASDEDQRMNTFISELMGKMTLEEKLGQLNLPASGDIITGAASNSNIGEKIKEGKAVIAVTTDGAWVGFCYIETWSV